MLIRTITAADYEAVATLIKEAFAKSAHGYHSEADLVVRLRQEVTYQPTLEIVAEEAGEIIGHACLSQIQIQNEMTSTIGCALAPLAVASDWQKRGVGQQLVLTIERRAKEQGLPFMSILGDPNYYQRFGYGPASKYAIQAPFDVPDEAFMIKELTPEGLQNIHGTVVYVAAFGL